MIVQVEIKEKKKTWRSQVVGYTVCKNSNYCSMCSNAFVCSVCAVFVQCLCSVCSNAVMRLCSVCAVFVQCL